jgi:GNAT superfamily N-acetyltransferase
MSGKYCYRQAADGDWPLIYELVRAGQQSWPGGGSDSVSALRRRLRRPIPEKQVWVCPQAVAIWFPEVHSISPRPEASDGDVHLGTFFVARAAWGSGLADDFIVFCQQQMITGGAKHARLWTPTVAHRAQAFYRRHGWVFSQRQEKLGGTLKREYLRPLITGD